MTLGVAPRMRGSPTSSFCEPTPRSIPSSPAPTTRRSAFSNIGRTLRPDGRIAFLAWQRFEDNEWLTEMFDALGAGRDLPTPKPGSPAPFGLADPDRRHRDIPGAGFVDGLVDSLTEPLSLGANADAA